MLISFVVPVAAYHTEVSAAAVASIQAQTLPCAEIVVMDAQKRGAGATRNEGLSRVTTPFVSFLDADDTIRPDFATKMLERWQAGRYVYCDDYQGDSLHQTPDCEVWQTGTWHGVTALVPTAIARAIGGFDETLPAIEDLDFFLRLQAAGVCGIRCPEPLLYYTQGGQRSREFRETPGHQQTITQVFTKHITRVRQMCKCNEKTIVANQPMQQQDGDILATALYTPQRKFGPISGRLYARPRGVDNYQLYVDPRDASARPEWWEIQRPIDAVGLSPDPDEIRRLALEALSG